MLKTFGRTIITIALLLLTNCQDSNQESDEMNQLLKTDQEFGQLAKSNGVAHAYEKYMADDAMVLRNGRPLTVGRSAIDEMNATIPEEGIAEWIPHTSKIMESGDMGYTSGQWRWSIPDSTGQMQTSTGNYFTFWKKQDGEWKLFFDVSTDGPAEEQPRVN